MKKVLFTVTVLLLVVAFGVSAFMVGNYLIDGKQQEDRYNQLADIATQERETTAATTEAVETEATTEPEETTEATEPTMIAGYEELYNLNSDTVGWLKIDGTQLNYPVMQIPGDNEYYLKHNFDKRESARGSVYAWGDADINEPSDNITLFGHNMADGSMFACLNAYTSQGTWERNSLIIFDTLYEYHTYEIFAVFATSANLGEGFSYHQFVNAETEEEFNEFVSTCKKLAFYDTGITPVYGDKMICLSTCTYSLNGLPHDNARLVVAAKRIT